MRLNDMRFDQIYIIFYVPISPLTILGTLRWNLKNLSRGLNPPKTAKTRFKFSAGLNL